MYVIIPILLLLIIILIISITIVIIIMLIIILIIMIIIVVIIMMMIIIVIHIIIITIIIIIIIIIIINILKFTIIYLHSACVRPIFLLMLSLLRFFGSKYLGNSLWTCEVHPLRLRFCLSQPSEIQSLSVEIGRTRATQRHRMQSSDDALRF